MQKVFGDYIEDFPPELDSLEIIFTPTSHSIRKRWSNNRLSAQFVADYCSTFLPVDDDDPDGTRRIKESKGAITYIANELLENAMKFNDRDSNFKVKFGIYFIEDIELENGSVTAVLFVTNGVNPDGVDKFQAFLTELLASDPEELYVTQVEKSMEEEHSEASGLGFLTMINDYSAKLGWKFQNLSTEPQIYTVTTMVQVRV
ncbi:MAG: DUF6272 family protein [Prochloraceae cyanobacterium]|nr:DUF6272 family protein [Xenococcaceae cyanobacterium MO_167.B52]